MLTFREAGVIYEYKIILQNKILMPRLIKSESLGGWVGGSGPGSSIFNLPCDSNVQSAGRAIAFELSLANFSCKWPHKQTFLLFREALFLLQPFTSAAGKQSQTICHEKVWLCSNERGNLQKQKVMDWGMGPGLQPLV